MKFTVHFILTCKIIGIWSEQQYHGLYFASFNKRMANLAGNLEEQVKAQKEYTVSCV